MGGCIGGKGRVDPTPRLGGIRDKLSFLLFLMKREEDPKTKRQTSPSSSFFKNTFFNIIFKYYIKHKL